MEEIYFKCTDLPLLKKCVYGEEEEEEEDGARSSDGNDLAGMNGGADDDTAVKTADSSADDKLRVPVVGDL